MTEPLDGLTADTFRPHVGATFTSSSAAADLVLVDVETPGDAASLRPFTLTFTSQTRFGQGTYDVEHPELGRLDVFLVPRQPGADGIPRYDAVFN